MPQTLLWGPYVVINWLPVSFCPFLTSTTEVQEGRWQHTEDNAETPFVSHVLTQSSQAFLFLTKYMYIFNTSEMYVFSDKDF